MLKTPYRTSFRRISNSGAGFRFIIIRDDTYNPIFIFHSTNQSRSKQISFFAIQAKQISLFGMPSNQISIQTFLAKKVFNTKNENWVVGIITDDDTKREWGLIGDSSKSGTDALFQRIELLGDG